MQNVDKNRLITSDLVVTCFKRSKAGKISKTKSLVLKVKMAKPLSYNVISNNIYMRFNSRRGGGKTCKVSMPNWHRLVACLWHRCFLELHQYATLTEKHICRFWFQTHPTFDSMRGDIINYCGSHTQDSKV